MAGIDSLEELMKTKEGREFWDKHGFDFFGYFDLNSEWQLDLIKYSINGYK